MTELTEAEQIAQGLIPNPAYAPPADGIWSIEVLRERCKAGLIPTMKFTPEETVPLSWNQVTVYVTRGVEIEVPHMFYDEYTRSRKATIEAFANAEGSLRKRAFGEGQVTVGSGWNGNAPA